MSIIEQNLNDVPEKTNLEPGEHKVMVKSADVQPNKDGTRDQIVVTIVPTQNADSVWPMKQYFPLVSPDHEKYDTYRRMLKDFCVAFGVPINKKGQIDTADMVGKAAFVIVKLDTYEGKTKAVIDTYVRPAML